MSRYTSHFGLLAIEPGDDPYQDGHKFFAVDRDTIDTALWLSLSGHLHDGVAGATLSAPASAPELTLETTGGTISGGTRLWYTYTLVDETTNQESAPAPVSFIDTPDPIDPPDTPTLSWGSGSGTLLPGQYFYVLTAWTDVNTNETQAQNAIGVIVSGTAITNRIIITLPALPFGADGFNIYRREPGGSRYLYLDSVNMDIATPPTEYVDNGSVTEDCDRFGPSRNTTNGTNAITITYPGATPTVPDGYFWKIYRTIAEDVWTISSLHLVVEETTEGSGVITPEYLDQGEQTTTGEPPSGTFTYSNPNKIVLTDGDHVQGTLPMGMTAYPFSLTLVYPMSLYVNDGTLIWRCPFDQAEILWVAANLGRGSSPASTDVIIDIEHYDANIATPAWSSLWDNDSQRPRIAVGGQFGDETYPLYGRNLVQRHDALALNINQTGGGATPTDLDLTVTIYMIALVPVMTSYVYNPTAGANAALGY